jgi:hypothetical protein
VVDFDHASRTYAPPSGDRNGEAQTEADPSPLAGVRQLHAAAALARRDGRRAGVDVARFDARRLARNAFVVLGRLRTRRS